MITKLALQNFRNFSENNFSFSSNINVIIGPNAIGKTNILESIYLISSAKSFKNAKVTELINEEKEVGRVKGLVDDLKLEVVLPKNAYKKFLINGVAKRSVDFSGNLKVVLFAPQDLDLITLSPSLRRNFLDHVLSLVDIEYRRSLLSYEKGVRSRNKLLFRIREEHLPTSQLLFWNQLLIKNGTYITQKREELINFINLSSNLNVNDYKLIYNRSIISEKRLNDYQAAEIASANTLVGPHRDDFIFQYKNHNLESYGSRGEQRMAILWLKLSELNFIESITKTKPTLLLDDIFSELDEAHRELVYEISKNQQTIITTADPEFVRNMKIDTKIELGI